MEGSWRSVQASWTAASSDSCGDIPDASPWSATSARPCSSTVTDSTTVSCEGKKFFDTWSRSGPGPESRLWVRAVANCSPRGTSTGSGTRMLPVGSR